MATSKVTVKLSGPFYHRNVERLVRELAPLLHLEEPAEIAIDCRGLAGIGPSGLALLKAGIARVQQGGLIADGSRIIRPKNPRIATYLQRMDMLKEPFVQERDEEFVRHKAQGFRPCRQFVGDPDGREMARDFVAAMEESVQVDRIGHQSMDIALNELSENVWYHADSDIGGFAAAQTYRDSKMFEISLRQNSSYVMLRGHTKRPPRRLEPPGGHGPRRSSSNGHPERYRCAYSRRPSDLRSPDAPRRRPRDSCTLARRRRHR